MRRDYLPFSNMASCSTTASFTADAKVDYVSADEMDGCYALLGTSFDGYEEVNYVLNGDGLFDGQPFFKTSTKAIGLTFDNVSVDFQDFLHVSHVETAAASCPTVGSTARVK